MPHNYHDYTLVGFWFAVGIMWETGIWLHNAQRYLLIGQWMRAHPGFSICGAATLLGFKFILDDCVTTSKYYHTSVLDDEEDN